MNTLSVDVSDLFKIYDVLRRSVEHHKHRDISNAALHLAGETRYSPLTSELMAAEERLRNILGMAA